MKQSFQLNIENPCQEQWETFTPTSTGGFCASCQKNVIDFSQMSESQLVAFFRDRLNSSQNLCGRFREDQLKKDYAIEEWFPTWSIQNNQVQYEIPVAVLSEKGDKQHIKLPLIHNIKAVRSIAAAMLIFLCSEKGIGQNRVVSGQIIDYETGDLLSGVSISIKGTSRGVITNDKGQYKISANNTDTLIFNTIGYTSIEKKASAIEVSVSMEMKSKMLDEVKVIGESSSRKGMTGLAFCISYATRNSTKTSEITVRGNAVQDGTAIIVPRLVSSLSLPKLSDIPVNEDEDDDEESDDDNTETIHANHVAPESIDEEKWFQENGFQEVTSVQLYDYSGKVYCDQFTKLSDGMISLDVKNIPRGAYIARVIYKNERSLAAYDISTVRILIER